MHTPSISRHAVALFVFYTVFLFNPDPGNAQSSPADRVRERESDFAESMARRDFDAFRSFLAEDAVFFSETGVLQGADAVASAWRPFFDGETAPFSWKPETVVVLSTGTLAHSSGPVTAPDGSSYGTFNSVWRLDPDGVWRIIFDKGCAATAPRDASDR